jgi:hypothetical protein
VENQAQNEAAKLAQEAQEQAIKQRAAFASDIRQFAVEFERLLIATKQQNEAATSLVTERFTNWQRDVNKYEEQIASARAEALRDSTELSSAREASNKAESDLRSLPTRPVGHRARGLLVSLMSFDDAMRDSRKAVVETGEAWDRLIAAEEVQATLIEKLSELQVAAAVDTSRMSEREKTRHNKTLEEIVECSEKLTEASLNVRAARDELDEATQKQKKTGDHLAGFIAAFESPDVGDPVKVALQRVTSQLMAFSTMSLQVEEADKAVNVAAVEKRTADSTYRLAQSEQDASYTKLRYATQLHHAESQRIEAIRATNAVRSMQRQPLLPINLDTLNRLTREMNDARRDYNEKLRTSRAARIASRRTATALKRATDNLKSAVSSVEQRADQMQREISESCAEAAKLAREEITPFIEAQEEWDRQHGELARVAHAANEHLAQIRVRIEKAESDIASINLLLESLKKVQPEAIPERYDWGPAERGLSLALRCGDPQATASELEEAITTLTSIQGLRDDLLLCRNSLVVRIRMQYEHVKRTAE